MLVVKIRGLACMSPACCFSTRRTRAPTVDVGSSLLRANAVGALGLITCGSYSEISSSFIALNAQTRRIKVTSTIDMAREGCDGPGGSSKKKSSNDKAGLIAGVAIACVAALLITAAVTYCCCRRSSSPAKSRREAPPSPQMSNPVVEKASRRDPDEQLEFQGGELR